MTVTSIAKGVMCALMLFILPECLDVHGSS